MYRARCFAPKRAVVRRHADVRRSFPLLHLPQRTARTLEPASVWSPMNGKAVLTDVEAAAIADVPNPVLRILLSAALARYEDAEHERPFPRRHLFRRHFVRRPIGKEFQRGEKPPRSPISRNAARDKQREAGCGILHRAMQVLRRSRFPLKIMDNIFCNNGVRGLNNAWAGPLTQHGRSRPARIGFLFSILRARETWWLHARRSHWPPR